MMTIQTTLKLFPDLKTKLPFICNCGKILKNASVQIGKDFIGIESESCTCGIYEKQGIFVARSKRANEKWKKLIIGKP